MRVALMVTVLNFILPFFFDHDADLNTNVACFIVTSALSSFKARAGAGAGGWGGCAAGMFCGVQ